MLSSEMVVNYHVVDVYSSKDIAVMYQSFVRREFRECFWDISCNGGQKHAKSIRGFLLWLSTAGSWTVGDVEQ